MAKKIIITLAVIVALALGILYARGLLSVHQGLEPPPQLAALALEKAPQAAPDVAFTDAAGTRHALSTFRGRYVLLNLWATWCAPCVKEMPTLAKLQSEYAGKPVKVIAISLDKGDADVAKARAFIADKAPLQFYHGDYSLAFSLTPAAEGLPTTLLFDRDGRERARLAGGADWSTPEAKAVIDRLLAQS